MNDKYFYITTPIYYVNDSPHIGHAYTNIVSDVIARFKRLNNYKVKFLTGTDEHGQKVEKSAKNQNIDPKKFTDINAEKFLELAKNLNISNNDFIRTTEIRHKNYVEKFWQKLESNNFIYLGNYSGWYSVRDEAYYAESELENGLAPTGAPVEWLEEESYFFKLSEFQDKLLEFYENNPDFVHPNTRYNEVKSFVKRGLKDLSISRTSFSWGIKVPNNPKHVIYVWLDALTNYLSALQENGEANLFWPAHHIVGKDILTFHAIYWPCFLMAANIELPKKIIAHGWWTNNGQKISKSLGNVIDPNKLVEKYGLDNVRYFLMREMSFGNDGDYSDESLINRVNSELANNIGNLLQRSLTMLQKNFDNIICNDELDTELEDINQLIINYVKHIDDYEFNLAIEKIIFIASKGNSYLEKKSPWKLADSPKEMAKIIYNILEILGKIAIMLQIFTPDSAEKMLNMLNIDSDKRYITNLSERKMLNSGHKINKAEIIFPKLEKNN